MAHRILSTIGYEGIALDRFLSLLREHGIETVVDIREVPFSRKPGFSKAPLAESLQRTGTAYVHLRQLGSPKAIRHRHRTDGDWKQYTSSFLEYLATQGEALDELASLATQSRCALLCFEADPNGCHRSMVAAAVSGSHGFEVAHIRVATKAGALPPENLTLPFG